MKILNICAYTWEIGGPARMIYDHTTEALKHGHRVDILSPMSPTDKAYPVPDGARLIPCKRAPFLSKVYREFSWDLWWYLVRNIKQYDVIHIHGIWHFGSVAPFFIDHKIPKAITIHGLLDKWALRKSQWRKDLVTALFQKRFLERADLIHAISQEETQDIAKYLGKMPKNMAFIPNGLKMEDYASLPAKGTFKKDMAIAPEKKMILFMGRLNIKKGIDILLPAFREYLQEFDDAVLVLAGPDDGYLAQTERFISDSGLADKILIAGMLTGEKKKAALADAHLFVLPTYSEGFSIAVLEAMAAQVPTLLSSRTGFDEYIRKYDAAIPVELNVKDVAERLSPALQNETLRTKVVRNAFTMVKENFEIRVVAQELLKELEKISKKK